ncbi:acyl--CoA ligase [Candidatus Saccharibacteria bacterium]|nr:acyl--CoA ligase [Candidatus Saccharibacteria bacterium]
MLIKTGYPSQDKTHLEGIDKKKLNPKILPMSILGTFLLVNSKNMDEPAVEISGKVFSKQQLRDDTFSMMKSLKLFNLEKGSTFVIATPNLYQGIVLTMAANASGFRVAYSNSQFPAKDLAADINTHRAKVLLVYDRDADFAKEIFSETYSLLKIINVAPEITNPEYNRRYFFGPLQSFFDYDEFMFDTQEFHCLVRPTFLANLFSKKESLYLQTSGSTSGKPKILPFSNQEIYASLIYASNSTGTKTRDRGVKKVLCILPYRFPYGWMTIFVNLMGGNCVSIAEGASPEQIGEYYKLKPSFIYGTPAIFRAFMDNTPEDADLSFLKAFFCSGFSISEEWYQEGMQYLKAHNSNAEIRNNYGIGEGMCIGTASDGVEHRPNTSGKFYVGPEWVLVDDELNEVKYGEVGEALVWSKSLCHGYLGDEEKTRESFIPFRGKTFYRTGDYLSLAEDGYVTFLGRKKRFYQPLGATDKVNCETIEKALEALPELVESCAVIIKFDEKTQSETSRAFVVPKDTLQDEESLRTEIFLKLDLLPYQMPGSIVFLKEIPLMKSGKINYTMLERM